MRRSISAAAFAWRARQAGTGSPGRLVAASAPISSHSCSRVHTDPPNQAHRETFCQRASFLASVVSPAWPAHTTWSAAK